MQWLYLYRTLVSYRIIGLIAPAAASVLLLSLWLGLSLLAQAPVQAETTAQFSCTQVTQIPQSECEALVALYESTNGPGWFTRTGWLETNTPCTFGQDGWFGVTCSSGRVTGLNLHRNGLTGTLPPALGNLHDLTELRLFNSPDSENWKLTGEIPQTWVQMQKLNVLHLHYNNIQGEVPEWLGNLPNLRSLILRFNPQLGGFIPQSLPQQLQELDLGYTSIRGEIPDNLGQLSKLRILRLSSHSVGEIPQSLGGLVVRPFNF